MVDDYAQSFRDVLAFEKSNPKDPKVLREFAEALIRVRDRHTNTVIFMAEAVMEMKNKVMRDSRNGYHQKQPKYMENVQYFLDRLYTSRISTRMLINQHTTLFTELDKAVSINFFAKRILCVEQKSKQSKVRGPIQIFKMKYFFKCRLSKKNSTLYNFEPKLLSM